MKEIKVFVELYWKNNVGSWFTLPASHQAIEATLRKVSGDENVEEYLITDYEAPFKIEGTPDLDWMNEIALRLQDAPKAIVENLGVLLEFKDIEEILKQPNECLALLKNAN